MIPDTEIVCACNIITANTLLLKGRREAAQDSHCARVFTARRVRERAWPDALQVLRAPLWGWSQAARVATAAGRVSRSLRWVSWYLAEHLSGGYPCGLTVGPSVWLTAEWNSENRVSIFQLSSVAARVTTLIGFSFTQREKPRAGAGSSRSGARDFELTPPGGGGQNPA